MGLIKCKFCGESFDDSLENCIHCGKGINEKVTKKEIQEIKENKIKKEDASKNFIFPKEIEKKDKEIFIKYYKRLINDLIVMIIIFGIWYVLFGFNIIYLVDFFIVAIGLLFSKRANKLFGYVIMIISIMFIITFLKNTIAALLGIFLLVHSLQYIKLFKKK